MPPLTSSPLTCRAPEHGDPDEDDPGRHHQPAEPGDEVAERWEEPWRMVRLWLMVTNDLPDFGSGGASGATQVRMRGDFIHRDW